MLMEFTLTEVVELIDRVSVMNVRGQTQDDAHGGHGRRKVLYTLLASPPS